MVKKGANILFVFSVAVMLLAYVLIPHHHHTQKLCIDTSHCEVEHDACDHELEAHEHDHDHDAEGDVDYCAFDQIDVVQSSQKNKFFKQFSLQNNILHINVVPKWNINLGLLQYTLNVQATGPPIYLSTYCSREANSTVGLRAPPIV